MPPRKRPADRRVVIHVRIPLTHQEEIAKVVKERGHPHTNSSVTAEMIGVGLGSLGGKPRRPR